MRPLIISALAATLMGCACFAPQQAQRITKTEKPIAAKKENPRHRVLADTHRKNAKSDILPKMGASSSIQSHDKSNIVVNEKSTPAAKTDTPQPAQADGKSNSEINQKSIATKTEIPQSSPTDGKSNIVVNEKSTIAETAQSSPLDDKSDAAVIKKAKAAIAAKMENPASIEFAEMKRAFRKNADGKSIDCICGYVREKTASGVETRDRPFLYLVQEDAAYIGGYGICAPRQ